MTYLENETGIDMNVQFDLSADAIIKYRRAYVGICCHVQGVVEISAQNSQDTASTASTASTATTEATKSTETATTTTEETQQEDTNGKIPEEDQEEASTGTVAITQVDTKTAATGGKRMLGRDTASCFGFAFYCDKVNGCKDTLSVGVALMASEVRSTESMIWKPTDTDMSSGNYGAQEQLDDKEYTTRYKFNRAQAAKSNIPKKDASMTCFGAFDVPYAEYKFTREINLKNIAKFPLVR